MTPECIQQIKDIENAEFETLAGEGPFTALSIEQLLYAAIKSTSIEEVRTVLEVTDWDRWIVKRVLN